jgi:hypothetical protein
MSKLSVVLFIKRLVTHGSTLEKFTLGLMGALLASMVAFVVATSLQCDLLAPWDVVGDSCPSWVRASEPLTQGL